MPGDGLRRAIFAANFSAARVRGLLRRGTDDKMYSCIKKQFFGRRPLCFFDPPTPYMNVYNGGPSLAVLNFPEKNFGMLWEFVIVFN